ncbi:hypothetical protein AGLY_014735 [Aphis glycines]|uniref:Uncharacterized protein n=1 Tax=Aphis glycines TaxID=307491 RepID=A0A6G0T2W4_APHGL|nr:hypothetical protein AGLY_014735 [Aphis glycines]
MSNTVKYMLLDLDKQLAWNNHIRTKLLILNARLVMFSPLLSKTLSVMIWVPLSVMTSKITLRTRIIDNYQSTGTNANLKIYKNNLDETFYINTRVHFQSLLKTIKNPPKRKNMEDERIVYYKRYKVHRVTYFTITEYISLVLVPVNLIKKNKQDYDISVFLEDITMRGNIIVSMILRAYGDKRTTAQSMLNRHVLSKKSRQNEDVSIITLQWRLEGSIFESCGLQKYKRVGGYFMIEIPIMTYTLFISTINTKYFILIKKSTSSECKEIESVYDGSRSLWNYSVEDLNLNNSMDIDLHKSKKKKMYGFYINIGQATFCRFEYLLFFRFIKKKLKPDQTNSNTMMQLTVNILKMTNLKIT